jgi:hypothetical protein
MNNRELEELKLKVSCAAALEHLGFALDLKESTRNAMKYRRKAAIIIVVNGGKDWFDRFPTARAMCSALSNISMVCPLSKRSTRWPISINASNWVEAGANCWEVRL